MGRYLQSRDAEIVVPEPSWRKISRGRFGSWPKTKNGSHLERNSAPTNATSASLRSENDERRSAVEMLGNPAKTKSAGFPHFHRAGGFSHSPRTKHEAETKFQLTDHGHFQHDRIASVASLRP